jgi:hypothetical protein
LRPSRLRTTAAPARKLILAYHQRWEIELVVDELKTHRGPARPFRSQRPVGVLQEIYGLLIAHYLLRALAVTAAHSAQVAPTRVSFVAALRLLRDHVVRGNWYRSPCRCVGRHLSATLSTWLLPARVERLNPRVVKQKMTTFRVKTAAHLHWPQPSKPFAEAIVLLIRTVGYAWQGLWCFWQQRPDTRHIPYHDLIVHEFPAQRDEHLWVKRAPMNHTRAGTMPQCRQ